jgi:hypothetical protein
VWRRGVAADYARHFLGAWVATRQAVDSLGLGDPVERKAREDADWLVNEPPTFLGPVLLMFGKDIEAAADAALVKLQGALECQHQGRADDARSGLNDARLSERNTTT